MILSASYRAMKPENKLIPRALRESEILPEDLANQSVIIKEQQLLKEQERVCHRPQRDITMWLTLHHSSSANMN